MTPDPSPALLPPDDEREALMHDIISEYEYLADCALCILRGQPVRNFDERIEAMKSLTKRWRARTRPSASAPGRWVALAENVPSYGQAVWCYWPPIVANGEGMQGVAVRAIRASVATETHIVDYWHADQVKYAERFTPSHWQPLPAPPEADDTNPQARGGAGT